MSRTEAHAPYHVHTNRDGSAVHHDHLRFGQPVTRSRKVRDERGIIVTEDVFEKVTVRQALAVQAVLGDDADTAARKRKVYKEARRRRNAGAELDELIDGLRFTTRAVTEAYVAGHYADRCTAGEKTDREGRLLADPELFAPCTMHLTKEEHLFPRNPVAKATDWYRDPREPRRANVRDELRRLTVAAQAGDDLEDLPEILHR